MALNSDAHSRIGFAFGRLSLDDASDGCINLMSGRAALHYGPSTTEKWSKNRPADERTHLAVELLDQTPRRPGVTTTGRRRSAPELEGHPGAYEPARGSPRESKTARLQGVVRRACHVQLANQWRSSNVLAAASLQTAQQTARARVASGTVGLRQATGAFANPHARLGTELALRPNPERRE